MIDRDYYSSDRIHAETMIDLGRQISSSGHIPETNRGQLDQHPHNIFNNGANKANATRQLSNNL
jgi:hypothetical protein